MMPNHGGDPLGPSEDQWGPIGAKKWVKTVKNCHAPKFEFFTTPRSSICVKNRIYSYDAKSRCGPPRSILGPMGSHWGQKLVKTVKNNHAPKFEFWLLRRHQFGQKMVFTVMMPNHGGDPRGPSWDQWGPIGAKKWVKTVKNYHASNSNLWLLRGHRFRQKIELTVKAPNHGGEPLGSILGPMGCHWDKKMGQNRKKLPCPKIRIFDYYARGHRFGQKKNYIYGTKSRWGPPRVHLGVNGDQLGPKNQKMGENRKKLPCPRIFDYSTVIDLGKKSNLRLWCQITVGNPWGPS